MAHSATQRHPTAALPYPGPTIPANAAAPVHGPENTVSLEIALSPNGDFLLTDTSGHTNTIPISLSGLRLLRQLLIAKHFAQKASKPQPIGTNAKPIQNMVEKYLKNSSELVGENLASMVAEFQAKKAIEEQERMENALNELVELF